MNNPFYFLIENNSAQKKDRIKNGNLALRNSEFYLFLVQRAFDCEYPHHHKACWIVELIALQKIKSLTPYVALFLENTPRFTNPSAIRPAAKICFLLAKSNHRSNGIKLLTQQELDMTEQCFAWLIGDTKVAAKVYAAKALFFLGKKHHWIATELVAILQQNYSTQSAAYKATARLLLKRLHDKVDNGTSF